MGKQWTERRLSLFLCFRGVSQCRLHFKTFIDILRPEIYLVSFIISSNLMETRFHYQDQLVNAVWGSNRCVL
jgi:hypothetical protein